MKCGTLRLLIFLICVLLTSPLSALDPVTPINTYLLDEWGADKGFPSDSVYAIVQTPDGYLWFGASKGLVRYDGKKFETFVPDTSIPPRERWVGDALVDKHGTAWFSGQHGLTRYQNKRFKTFTTNDGLSGNIIMTIAEDSFDGLWIGTYNNYLNLYKDGTFTVFNASHGLEAKEINALCEDAGGVLWVGGRSTGLFYKQGETFTHFNPPGFDGKLSVSVLYTDQQNRLWIGSDKGLIGLTDPLSENTRVIRYTTGNGLMDNNIESILEDTNNNLWVGTGRALHRLRNEADGTVKVEPHLYNTMIPCIFEDREKSLWIGTFRFGLKRLRDGVIKTLFTKDGIPPYKLALYQDHKDDTWMGSIYGNLFKFEDDICQWFLQSGNMNMEITAISDDRDGNLWFGTTSMGVFRMLDGQAVNAYTAGGDGADFPINTLFHDSRGKLWVGSGGGMLAYEMGGFTPYTTRNGLSGNTVNNIFEDRHNNIWVATDKGVDVLQKGRWDRDTKLTYLAGRNVFGIHEDKGRDGLYWICTYDSGLVRLDVEGGTATRGAATHGTATFYTIKNGLPGNTLFQLLEDARGNFWISSPDGIIKTAKHELEELAGGRADHITGTLFGLSDGMLNTQCIKSARNSAIKVGDDEFWFATQKGISVVRPGKISINKYPPGVVIEKILFNGGPIPPGEAGQTYRGIQNIRFHFTAPSFISPNKVKVFYRLEGYESAWRMVEPFRERTAWYQDLPPGEYRFHVTAANSDGIRNPDGASFNFTLKKYVYQTAWFKILSLLLALLTIAAAVLGLKKYLYLRELNNKYKHSTLDPKKAEQALKKLHHLLEVKKVFKDEDLSLKSLAAKLLISPRYLSQVMNERLNKNFWELVNGYRIEEAKHLLTTPRTKGQKDYSILDIALEVGFSSKVVFNRVFKKHTGMTPTQFKARGARTHSNL